MDLLARATRGRCSRRAAKCSDSSTRTPDRGVAARAGTGRTCLVANCRSGLDGPARSHVRAIPRRSLESTGQLSDALPQRRRGDSAYEPSHFRRQMALRARRLARRHGTDSGGLHVGPSPNRMRRALSGRPSRSRSSEYLPTRIGPLVRTSHSLPTHRSQGQRGRSTWRPRPIGAFSRRRGQGAGVVPRHRSQHGSARAHVGVRGVVLGIAEENVGEIVHAECLD